ncbi:MAG: hypothetical protein ACR2LI_13165 [Propionibacteriaceae bacterium]
MGHSRPRALRAGARRWLALPASWLTLALLLAGCGVGPRPEPGLFGRPGQASSSPTVSDRTRAPSPSNLPVLADSTWTTTDGLGVTVRMAVHAIRRIPGATVLDWSITPLSAAGLNTGDDVPEGVELGLQRFGDGDTNVFLTEPAHRRLYRPLSARGSTRHCLCTPIWLVQRRLQVGRTRLLQLSFPRLPADVSSVSVLTLTMPPMTGLPVTPINTVPRAEGPADLTRPVQIHPALASTPVFTYRGRTTGQQYVVFVEDVVTSAAFTTLRWTVQMVTDGDGLRGLPPLAAGRTDPYTYDEASGPVLRLPRGGTTRTAQLVTTTLDGRGTTECLCSNLDVGYAASGRTSQRITLVTIYPGLPTGTRRVDVAFPGLPTLADIPTTVATETRGAGPPIDAGLLAPSWTYDPSDPPGGWDVAAWPTPLPERSQLADYVTSVDRLR